MTLKGKALQVSILLAIAVAFGGGGSGAGLANLVVQVAALTLFACNSAAFIDFFKSAPRVPALLVGCALILPLMQSIPLPPFVWHALPGRNIEVESLAMVGGENAWVPMSLEVRRTLLAFLSLVPPAMVVILGWKLPDEQKRKILLVIVMLAVAVVLLGAQQLALGNRRFIFFDEAVGSAYLQGTFASHNAVALFLDVALCALIEASPKRKMEPKWVLAAGCTGALLVIGIILTRSRSGMALAAVPLALAALRAGRLRSNARESRRMIVAVALCTALLIGGVSVLAVQNQRVQNSFARFTNFEDERPAIWSDTLGSIKRFWPLGSGIGTFDEVFQLDETLENIKPGRAARAHNDFLETALESGIVGIVLVVAWGTFLAVRSARALRTGGPFRASAAALGMIALQSISDFPLRNQTLLCVAGMMVAFMIRLPSQQQASVLSIERSGFGT